MTKPQQNMSNGFPSSSSMIEYCVLMYGMTKMKENLKKIADEQNYKNYIKLAEKLQMILEDYQVKQSCSN